MYIRLLGIVMLFRLLQLQKAYSPRISKVLGSRFKTTDIQPTPGLQYFLTLLDIMCDKLVQFSNARSLILSKPSYKQIVFRLLQPLKACCPMLLIVFGIRTVSILSQSLKALLAIPITVFPFAVSGRMISLRYAVYCFLPVSLVMLNLSTAQFLPSPKIYPLIVIAYVKYTEPPIV